MEKLSWSNFSLAGREVARDSCGSFHNLFMWILPLYSTLQGPPVPGREGMAHAIPEAHGSKKIYTTTMEDFLWE